jgi:hypothetical protein
MWQLQIGHPDPSQLSCVMLSEDHMATPRWCLVAPPGGSMFHYLIGPFGHPKCQINMPRGSLLCCHNDMMTSIMTSTLHTQVLMSSIQMLSHPFDFDW